MNRETDLIDVWFDSGAMPYAQWGLKKDHSKGSAFNEGFNQAFPCRFYRRRR
jgi:isoleucyl-tRNA synthetase